jgi:hypothetical protein
LLPDWAFGRFVVDFTGLGDLRRRDEPNPDEEAFGKDSSAGAAAFRVLDGVFRDFPVLGRFSGVLTSMVDCGGRKVFVDARKSTGIDCFEPPALDDGLELTDLDGGLIDGS